jgi:hypothetical protein
MTNLNNSHKEVLKALGLPPRPIISRDECEKMLLDTFGTQLFDLIDYMMLATHGPDSRAPHVFTDEELVREVVHHMTALDHNPNDDSFQELINCMSLEMVPEFVDMWCHIAAAE